MANQEPTTATFRKNQLARVGVDFDSDSALNGKLVRLMSNGDKATGKINFELLNDRVRPLKPIVPRILHVIDVREMREILRQTCEYCLVASAAKGNTLQMCGRCKTAHLMGALHYRPPWREATIRSWGSCSGQGPRFPSSTAQTETSRPTGRQTAAYLRTAWGQMNESSDAEA